MEKLLIILGIVGLLFFFMRRGGMGMGCCGGQSHGGHSEHSEERAKQNPKELTSDDRR